MLYISKVTLKILALYTLIIAALSFSSCGDETIMISKEDFDPPRYSWESDTIEAIIRDIWACDSSNVYFADEYYNLIHYDGSRYNFINYGGDIYVTAMTGIDKNHIYAAGANLFSRKLMIKKWNGSTFENLIISDTMYFNTIITSIRAISPTNIWLCTSNGRVFNYNGTSFDVYYIDSTFYLKPLMLDGLGGVYVAGDDYNPLLPSTDSINVLVKKFENDRWITKYEKTYPESIESANINFFNIGNELIRVNLHNILRYNGNDFVEMISVNQFRIHSTFFGSSITDFLCMGSPDGSNRSLYQWNGIKWSKEFGVSELFPQRVFGIGNRYYVTYSDYDTFETIVYKGKMKH